MLKFDDLGNSEKPGPMQVTVCLSKQELHCAKVAATKCQETVPEWVAGLVTDACVTPTRRTDSAAQYFERNHEKT
jgi:hypothetical protein